MMKRRSRISAMVLITLSLAASEAILAEQTPGTTGGNPEWSGKRCLSQGDRAAWLEKQLQTLHSALKLGPNQEAAWNEWSDKIKRSHAGQHERRKAFESWSKLPAIERMEKQLAFAKERQSRHEERITATKAFYSLLTQEQTQIFDTQLDFWPRGKEMEFHETPPEKPA